MPRSDGWGPRLTRRFFTRAVDDVARDLLGRVVLHETDDGVVAVRLTEVEAYAGEQDPASHAWRGRTPRNAVMFGPPGHAYVYFTYGMHHCMNLVCGPVGQANAVLLRAGEVVVGADLAVARRPTARTSRDLARGPANLVRALGVSGHDDGADLCAVGTSLTVRRGSPVADAVVRRGPRVGLTRGVETDWRFWVDDEPTVTVWRAGGRRRTAGGRGSAA